MIYLTSRHLHLQTQFGEDRCTQFRVILVTVPPHPPTNRQDRLQYTAPQLARSVMTFYVVSVSLTWASCLLSVLWQSPNFRIDFCSFACFKRTIDYTDLILSYGVTTNDSFFFFFWVFVSTTLWPLIHFAPIQLFMRFILILILPAFLVRPLQEGHGCSTNELIKYSYWTLNTEL